MASSPYPLLSDVLNSLRGQINDLVVSNGGQTFTNTAAFSPVYTNRGYQMMQQELVNMGYVRLIVPNFLILNLPNVANEDTSLQVTLSWTGYNDGVTAYPLVVLPQTLIKPIKLMERLSGAAPNTNQFWDMSGPEQGVTRLPNVPKSYRNVIWVWNSSADGTSQAIWMPGATGLIDLRIDFASYLPDFLPNTTEEPAQFPGTQVVPFMRSTDCLAWYIAYAFSYARNDDPAVCAFALGEARRAAAIVAGTKLPTDIGQVQ